MCEVLDDDGYRDIGLATRLLDYLRFVYFMMSQPIGCDRSSTSVYTSDSLWCM